MTHNIFDATSAPPMSFGGGPRGSVSTLRSTTSTSRGPRAAGVVASKRRAQHQLQQQQGGRRREEAPPFMDEEARRRWEKTRQKKDNHNQSGFSSRALIRNISKYLKICSDFTLNLDSFGFHHILINNLELLFVCFFCQESASIVRQHNTVIYWSRSRPQLAGDLGGMKWRGGDGLRPLPTTMRRRRY